MTGHHVLGKRSVTLHPGVNEVPEDVGAELLKAELVIPIEETHFRHRVEPEPELEAPVNIGDIEPIHEDGRAEGTE
jgi:hypothetical protein